MDEEATLMKFPVKYTESMNTVLCQEQKKMNRLLRAMKASLIEVKKAVHGLIVMSFELESVADAIFTQTIPPPWSQLRILALNLRALGSRS